MTEHALRRTGWAAAGLVGLATLTACGGAATAAGDITVSGSSTVAPITQAVAEQGRFSVDIAAEGTINGFERFCAGESDINNASTAIPGDMVEACAAAGVDFIELPIGIDALTVVRNEANTFATELTMDELADIWAPDSPIETWADIRSTWPAEKISFFGREDGSGTYDYFTRTVGGEIGAIRDDVTGTHDMRELSGWIAGDENALGYMGVGNYLQADEDERDLITNIAVDGVLPTREDAQSGAYTPLTRPLFIYVAAEAAEANDAVAEFVDYYVEYVPNALPFTGFYALGDEEMAGVAARWEARTPGAAFVGDEFPSLADIASSLG